LGTSDGMKGFSRHLSLALPPGAASAVHRCQGMWVGGQQVVNRPWFSWGERAVEYSAMLRDRRWSTEFRSRSFLCSGRRDAGLRANACLGVSGAVVRAMATGLRVFHQLGCCVLFLSHMLSKLASRPLAALVLAAGRQGPRARGRSE